MEGGENFLDDILGDDDNILGGDDDDDEVDDEESDEGEVTDTDPRKGAGGSAADGAKAQTEARDERKSDGPVRTRGEAPYTRPEKRPVSGAREEDQRPNKLRRDGEYRSLGTHDSNARQPPQSRVAAPQWRRCNATSMSPSG